MEHAYGRGESLALGVEEELLLLDPASGRLAHAEGGMPRVLQRLISESAEPLGAPASAA